MRAIILHTFRSIFIYLLLCVATFLMLRIIIPHLTLNNDVGFLAYKQDYISIKIWRTAFYIHVFSAIFTLIAGFTQFSGYILEHHRKWHRRIGRFYACNIFFVNFPAAMIMAIYANGHLPSKIAFIILDILWCWFTVKAVTEARKGNLTAHRNFMIRSYALTCSAITLRAWKMVLVAASQLDAATVYMIIAWLGFIPNLLFAEWMIRRQIDRILPLERNTGQHNQRQRTYDN